MAFAIPYFLQAEWLSSVLHQRNIYTVRIGDAGTYIFEVLRVSNRVWAMIPPARTTAIAGRTLHVLALPYELWRRRSAVEMNVYVSGDAEHVDLTLLTSWANIHHGMQSWEHRLSGT